MIVNILSPPGGIKTHVTRRQTCPCRILPGSRVSMVRSHGAASASRYPVSYTHLGAPPYPVCFMTVSWDLRVMRPQREG